MCARGCAIMHECSSKEGKRQWAEEKSDGWRLLSRLYSASFCFAEWPAGWFPLLIMFPLSLSLLSFGVWKGKTQLDMLTRSTVNGEKNTYKLSVVSTQHKKKVLLKEPGIFAGNICRTNTLTHAHANTHRQINIWKCKAYSFSFLQCNSFEVGE